MLLSGGVDSSVAMYRCVHAGNSVTAYYLKIWFEESFENTWTSCPWQEDLELATKVCDMMGVELKVIPFTVRTNA